MLAIPNMTLYRQDRHVRKGGGVCIYVASKWAKYVSLIPEYTFSEPDVEMITLIMKKPAFRKLMISCVYRRPTGKNDVCIARLNSLITLSQTLNTEVWILGDFNYDYLVRDHLETKKYVSLFKNCGLNQLIHDITRPLATGGTCIDWVITSSQFIQDSGVGNDLVSDHFSVFAIRKKPWENHSTVQSESRDYGKYNLDIFRNLLLNTDWDVFENSNDPNTMYNIIIDRVHEILEIMCPLRKFQHRVNSGRWMNADIFRAIRNRKFYVTLFKQTRLTEHLRLSHIC